MPPTPRFQLRPWIPHAAALAAIPAIVVLVAFFAPLRTDAALKYSGLAYDADTRILVGEPTIDGNMGVTSQALGTRAALDVLGGRLPLWNHLEGLGAPLLGEMQSAALFPPTWLMALPHGQAIEQAVLQFAAGLGAFLFLRRFGLGAAAALAGGLLFEVNGVFAWLRNAIMNPVALLPWLFFAVEGLATSARAGSTGWRRAAPVAAAAAAAALAIVAGFPEEVYLYGLLLIVWALFRASSLSRTGIGRFAADLAAAGVGAAALSAPALVAFADFLRQAEVGGHVPGGFDFPFYDASALPQYILPYVYGTIFGSPQPSVVGLWSGTGGYIGFTPLVLAAAALLVPRRRPAKLVLLGWIVLALGVTHGVPGLYDAFHALPLMGIVAVPRYLDTSWIFCFAVLAALFLDDAAAMAPRRLRLTVAAALACGLACLGLAAAANGPMMADLWTASAGHRLLFGLAVATACGLSALIAGAASLPRAPALALGAIAVAEAAAWFAVPYLSYPRHGRMDAEFIAFLQANAGRQRVLSFETSALSPNYGSAIGVATLNYDDLPSPRLTAAYVRGRLDPYAGEIAFVPTSYTLPQDRKADRRDLVHARLDRYGDAGVALIVSGDGFDSVPPYGLDPAGRGGDAEVAPGAGLLLTGRIAPGLALPVSAVSVALGAPSSGHLDAALCAGPDCASGSADLAAAGGTTIRIAFDRELPLGPGDAYTLRLTRPGGEAPLALPLRRLAGEGGGQVAVEAGGRAVDGAAPDIGFVDARLTLAYSRRADRVYRLRHVRDYLSAPGCRIAAASRDRLTASCAAPSRLTRLELAMEGWSATVDGAAAPITQVDGAFQAIDLPAGDSQVAYRYAPRGFGPALAACLMALAAVFAVGFAAAGERLGLPGRRR